MPLVSVVVPTRNRPHMLAQALESVHRQTYSDREVIVVSNGESDDMRARSRACAAKYGAAYLELPEGNVSAARNFAIAWAKGEWIAFLDDDDIWLPQKTERQFAEAGRTGSDMIVCDCVHFFPDGHEEVVSARLPDGWSYAKAIHYRRWCAQPSAVMVRKRAVIDAGGFEVRFRHGEDLDLWRRIAWRHRIHHMGETLVRYRRHEGSTTNCLLRFDTYELRYAAKMWRDTPADLRCTLPSPFTVARRWLVRMVMPAWLRQPRRRWSALRPRIRAVVLVAMSVFGL